jgi:hypothetical protein
MVDLTGRTFVNETFSSFDDEREREAFLNAFREDKNFRKYIMSYFDIPEKTYFTFYNPDMYGVDFYVWTMETPDQSPGDPGTRKVGMIEIEHKTDWHISWPRHWQTIHHLKRKMKFVEEELPYVQVMFNSAASRFFTYTDKEINEAEDLGLVPCRDGSKDHFLGILTNTALPWGKWKKDDLELFGKLS